MSHNQVAFPTVKEFAIKSLGMTPQEFERSVLAIRLTDDGYEYFCYRGCQMTNAEVEGLGIAKPMPTPKAIYKELMSTIRWSDWQARSLGDRNPFATGF